MEPKIIIFKHRYIERKEQKMKTRRFNRAWYFNYNYGYDFYDDY